MSLKRKCSNDKCKGYQTLKHMISGQSKKSKGNFWICDTCDDYDSEFELDCGDFADNSIYSDKYMVVWVSKNPSTYIDEFSSIYAVDNFIHNELRTDIEYPLFVIRKSDFKQVEVKEIPRRLQKNNKIYSYDFN